MNVYWVAAAWIGLALLASLISIRVGISVALVELVVGAVVGNIPGSDQVVQQTEFTTFLATLGSAVLTFLAGAEIDPESLRRNWKPSLTLGVVSFVAPFAGALLFARFGLGWSWPASQIAGVALSTTSVAVVYAVMIESGLNRQEIGKLILAACFVTDLGTVLALGGMFADLDWRLAVFVAVTAVAMWVMPRLTRLVLRTVGGRISEPEIKFLFLVLFGLGGLASSARSEAVLPAYLIGLVVAGVFLRDRIIVDRLRTISFALLTPFFFIRAGLLVSFPALAAGAGSIALLFAVKMVTKGAAVWPTAAAFKMASRDRTYTTLLMATGLTFGSIAALYGLTNDLVTQEQYSILVTVVILSAFVPTLIAQQWFEPDLEGLDEEVEEAAGEEDLTTLHHPHHRAESHERQSTDEAPSPERL
ncbi:MAG: cation:proton antiporter [Nocardioides sp.]|jgi:Kef-type K+ transport system membrane component KefB